MKRVVALSVLAISVPLVAGCGGASHPTEARLTHAQYATRFTQAYAALNQTANVMKKAPLQSASVAQGLDAGAIRLSQIARELAAKPPPADAAADNAALIARCRDGAMTLKRIAKDITKGNVLAAESLLASVSQTRWLKAGNAAIRDLASKGYYVQS